MSQLHNRHADDTRGQIAAVYARKSTDQSYVADDQKSVVRQLERARQYAASKGWIVADEHVYADDGISGADDNRPGFMRLMAALKPRAPFDVLIMAEESRLGREAIATADALKQIIQAGVRLVLSGEPRADVRLSYRQTAFVAHGAC